MRKKYVLFSALIVATSAIIKVTNGTALCDGERLVIIILFGAVGVQVVSLISSCVITLAQKGKLTDDQVSTILYRICFLANLVVLGIGMLGIVVCFCMGQITWKGFWLMGDAMGFSCYVDTIMDAMDD